jgi:transposase
MRAGEAGEAPSGGDQRIGRSTHEETTLSETRRKYRKFTGRQKLELVMASLGGERSIAELCREHEISETLLRRWRDQALDAAQQRLDGGQDRSQTAEQRRRIAELERALGKKTYEAEILGNGFGAWE